MNIARLNRQITFLKREIVADEFSSHSSRWSEDFTCACTVSNQGGAISTGDGLIQAADTATFTTRYFNKTLAVEKLDYRIRFEDDIYEIESIDHYSYRGTMVRFSCVKVRDSNVR